MIKIDDRITEEGRRILRSFKGAKLERIEACFLGMGDFWESARLVGEKEAADIICPLKLYREDEESDYLEEIGCLQVVPAATDRLVVPDMDEDPTCLVVDKIVEQIAIFDYHAISFDNGVPFNEERFSQALAFCFTDGTWLTVDRGPFFSNIPRIRQGKSLDEMVRDDSIESYTPDEESPEITFEYESGWVFL